MSGAVYESLYRSEAMGRLLQARLIEKVLGANPAAGNEVSVVVPGDETWEVLAVVVAFTTSAVVANRRPSLVFDDGADIFAFNDSNTAQAASVTTTYSWQAGLGYEKAAALAGRVEIGMGCFTLRAGWRLRTVTLSLDVGDDYAAPVLLVRRYTPGTLRQLARLIEGELDDVH